jgi:hypothetical protein
VEKGVINGERLRAIETLAQQLYEQSEPGATPWAKRERTVRDAWLAKAKRVLELADGLRGQARA